MPVAKRSDNPWQEQFVLTFDHALASATTTTKLLTTQRSMRIDKVEYINPTGYTQDATNYFTIALKQGATAIATWSCLTGANGTIAADTFVNPTLSATDADRAPLAGVVLSLALTKFAVAANLPAGRIVVHGRYVS